MSGTAPALVRTFKVGRFECTLTFPQTARSSVLAMSAEWSPSMPERLTTAELKQYRVGRNAAIEELATIVGANVAVVE